MKTGIIKSSDKKSYAMLIFSKKHSINSVTIIQSILERYADIFLVNEFYIVYLG